MREFCHDQPPVTWPKELTLQWRTDVGDGVSTPALVGDALFEFTRQGNSEVIRCLDAATGVAYQGCVCSLIYERFLAFCLAGGGVYSGRAEL